MNNPVLLSGSFERAVSQFDAAMRDIPQIDTWPLRQIVSDFEVHVTRLRDIFGMQAENMQRAAVGSSMAYVEADFQKV